MINKKDKKYQRQEISKKYQRQRKQKTRKTKIKEQRKKNPKQKNTDKITEIDERKKVFQQFFFTWKKFKSVAMC